MIEQIESSETIFLPSQSVNLQNISEDVLKRLVTGDNEKWPWTCQVLIFNYAGGSCVQSGFAGRRLGSEAYLLTIKFT